MKVPLAALLFAACLTTADAETLALPDAGAGSAVALPGRGATMAAVERQYGAPMRRHAAVGGDQPQHPPITRWDYDGFAVFFENQHVVAAVRPDAPAPIVNREGLDR